MDVPYTMTLGDGTVYQTFCLEHDINFTVGHTYYIQSVGDTVQNQNDQIENNTIWLYAAYMSNVFSDLWDYAAQKVQNAIWWLEGENGGDESDWEYLEENYTFDDEGWNVVAVNIAQWNGDSYTDKQSQLVGDGPAPVPEPATMLLFGTGLVGLASVRLRRKKK